MSTLFRFARKSRTTDNDLPAESSETGSGAPVLRNAIVAAALAVVVVVLILVAILVVLFLLSDRLRDRHEACVLNRRFSLAIAVALVIVLVVVIVLTVPTFVAVSVVVVT